MRTPFIRLYVDAEACVVGFSTIDRDSFENVESWIKKVKRDVCCARLHAERKGIAWPLWIEATSFIITPRSCHP
jgi:hypothetical protein